MLVVWLALLSGGIQLALGAARAAWVLNLVSSPVLAGFSQGAALLIIASQIPALLGLQGPLSSLWAAPRFDLTALAYGGASLLLFVLAKRYLPRLPIVLLVIAAAAGLSLWTGYSAHGAVIGALPVGPAGPVPARAAGVGHAGRAGGAGAGHHAGEFAGDGSQRQDRKPARRQALECRRRT